MSHTLQGHLEAFAETGTEGIFWSFHEDGKKGYDGLHILQNGDRIRVFNDAARKEVLFEGVVELTHAPEQQRRCRVRSHGVPAQGDPEHWLGMFMAEKPAELVKKETNFTP